MSSRKGTTDWEVLQLRETTTLRTAESGGLLRTESSMTENSRVRVVHNGRMGDSFAQQGSRSLADHLAKAIMASYSGPTVSLDLGGSYPSNHVADGGVSDSATEALAFTGVLRSISEERSLHLRAASGGVVRWSSFEERLVYGGWLHGRPVPVACLGASEQGPTVPDVEIRPVRSADLLNTTWMLGPLALSEMIGRVMESQLARDRQLEWPRGVRVLDDGSGGNTDLEGVPRQKIVWCEDGVSCGRVRTFQDASSASQLTGHGGMSGFYAQNLTVISDESEDVEDAVVLIVGARPLSFSSDHFLLTALDGPLHELRGVTRIVARCTGAHQLASRGTWLGPQQYGNGPWRSPWLQLPEPGKVFQVSHVQ